MTPAAHKVSLNNVVNRHQWNTSNPSNQTKQLSSLHMYVLSRKPLECVQWNHVHRKVYDNRITESKAGW